MQDFVHQPYYKYSILGTKTLFYYLKASRRPPRSPFVLEAGAGLSNTKAALSKKFREARTFRRRSLAVSVCSG